MKKNKINLILLASDNSSFNIAMVKLAKIFNIPSIVIQHAINCTEIAFPMNSEYTFVFGQETKKWLTKNNPKTNKIFIIGCPRYDNFIPEKEEGRREKSILYIMEATNSNKFFPERSLTKKRQKQLLRILFKVLKKFKEYKLIIKTRSGWDMAELPSIITRQEKFTNLEIIEKTDNIKLLNNSDIVIINHTTMGVEALLLNKPVISISFKDLDDGNAYKKIKTVDVCYNEKQLEDAIKKNMKQTKEDYLKREKSLRKCLLHDAQASQRAVRLITQIIQENKNIKKLTKMKILALIPARGGSKSIPKKNIVFFGGYPLLAYSIAAAHQSTLINRVIVTTDDLETAIIAKNFQAETPFLRPKEIAKDFSLDIEFFNHCLNWLEKNEGYIPDLIIHLRPTTPLRDYRLIDKAIMALIKDKKATSLRSAHIFEDVGHKLFRIKKDYCAFFGKDDFNKKEYHNFPRQILPITYKPNGYVDIIIPKKLKETGLLHGKNIKPFITEKTIDVDHLKDLNQAKEVLKGPKWSKLIKKLRELKKESDIKKG
jgi:N-acylneuraminate cytidylyltransferase